MFHSVLLFAMFLLSISIVISMFRVIKGPSALDRAVALDSISYSIIGIVTLLCMMMDTQAYLETILLIGILAFLSTVAICKFVERGIVIEHKRND